MLKNRLCLFILSFIAVNYSCFVQASAKDEKVFYKTYIGEQQIIEKSQRTNIEYIPISILPIQARGNKNFPQSEMTSWSFPKRKSFHINLQNSFGQFGGTIVDLIYHIDYMSGGMYKNQGEYLLGINFSIDKLFIAGGLDLDVSTKVLSISNIGSNTNQTPLLLLEISFKASRLFRTEVYSDVFYISGDGRFERVEGTLVEDERLL